MLADSLNTTPFSVGTSLSWAAAGLRGANLLCVIGTDAIFEGILGNEEKYRPFFLARAGKGMVKKWDAEIVKKYALLRALMELFPLFPGAGMGQRQLWKKPSEYMALIFLFSDVDQKDVFKNLKELTLGEWVDHPMRGLLRNIAIYIVRDKARKPLCERLMQDHRIKRARQYLVGVLNISRCMGWDERKVGYRISG